MFEGLPQKIGLLTIQNEKYRTRALSRCKSHFGCYFFLICFGRSSRPSWSILQCKWLFFLRESDVFAVFMSPYLFPLKTIDKSLKHERRKKEYFLVCSTLLTHAFKFRHVDSSSPSLLVHATACPEIMATSNRRKALSHCEAFRVWCYSDLKWMQLKKLPFKRIQRFDTPF